MATTKRKPDFKKGMYELAAWEKSELVCGIDEVGRSCFAGPIVTAAVILKPNSNYRLLKDSKLMTAQERLQAYKWIKKNGTFAVGILHHRIIDKINIYHATLASMKRAAMQLVSIAPKKPSLILVDAMPLKFRDLDIDVVHFCYGERKSVSIAAASIVAKVTRDALMERLDNVIGGYSFLTNKGYGTAVHRAALKNIGSSIIHRHSFLKNYKSNSSCDVD